jgi:integrase
MKPSLPLLADGTTRDRPGGMTDLSDDEPITLAEACQLFPRAKLKLSTLRAEAARGRLTIFRIGKRDYTTAESMREMVRRCRAEDYRRDFTSTRSASNGLSATERILSAQAALMARLPRQSRS